MKVTELRVRARLPVGSGHAVAASAGALAVGAIPLFLVGALSTSMGDDLGYGPAGTGAAIATFFAVSGLTSVPVGWVTGRIGAPAAMRVGAVLSGASALGIGLLADSLLQVAVALAFGGVAIAFVDTGASEWFAAAVPADHQGMAFGIKEASVPAASLFAGLAVPLLASTFDWRVAFVIGSALVPVVWFVVPSTPVPVPAPAVDPGGRARWGPLALFAAGIAFGTGAATASSTFLVPALEDRGWSASTAGILLAVSSVGSIAIRLALGRATDRIAGSTWWFTSLAMALGAAGAALLAIPAGGGAVRGGVVLLGAFLVVAVGWGWTGLAFHAVLTSTLDRPALGAGLVLGGLSAGGAAGPSAFGALADATSFTTSWVVAAVSLAVAAACTDAARRWLRRVSPAVVEV